MVPLGPCALCIESSDWITKWLLSGGSLILRTMSFGRLLPVDDLNFTKVLDLPSD